MGMRRFCLFAFCVSFAAAADCSPQNATMKTCGGPLVQAHRVGCGEYDDNAAGGLRWCLANGVRGLEFDVRFTKDRHLVIMHDNLIDRTTDGSGWAEDLTLAELRRFRLDMSGEPVPTLDEMLAQLRGRKDFFAEIEMKVVPCPRYPREVIAEYCGRLNEAVKAALDPGTYTFTSFDIRTLRIMRATVPDAPLGYIIVEKMTEKHLEDAKALNCCCVAPMEATKEMIARAHDEGLSVCLWMCCCFEDYARFKDLGADRITTDYPVLLTRVISGRRKKVVALSSGIMDKLHSPDISERNMTALKKLASMYACVVAGPEAAVGDLRGWAGGLGFDLAPVGKDAYVAVMEWARQHGCEADDVVFVGDNFIDGSVGGAMRKKGVDCLLIPNHKRLWYNVRILTN